ncbi:MAG: cytidine deaminase [Thermoprotei archaeon]|nr:MAG: cytidine deaminase [Thermoprotei archaeon]
MKETYTKLVEEAKKVLTNSYAPYSGIHVASAILTRTGKVYLGVNVENASYGLTICAERAAIASMVTSGDKEPVAVAIVTDYEKPLPPCGACRQVLAEFNPDIVVVMYSVKEGKIMVKSLRELFPYPMSLK